MREWIVRRLRRGILVTAFVFPAVVLTGMTGPASAESLVEALASTYRNNPDLNAERASLRAIDENVSQALSTGRPTVLGSADVAARTSHSRLNTAPFTFNNNDNPRGYSITLTQPIFRGLSTVNSTRQAESLVQAGREGLKNTEQNILFSAAEAYMNVFRDVSIVKLNRGNVRVLNEQLRATRDRFSVGEVTRTDVAQAEARVALAASTLSLANSQLATSRAVYQQIIGHMPNGVRAPRTISHLLPNSIQEAIAIGEATHPAVLAAEHAVDAAHHEVAVNKGSLLPEVDVEATWSQRYDISSTTKRSDVGTITGRITVPIYQRGQVSSQIRQSLETETQRRIEADSARHQVRAAIVSAWGALTSAQAQIKSERAQVSANQVALDGVREENKVGQRTVLDVLNAEQALLDSRVSLVSTQRDVVVAGYALLSAIGSLDVRTLGLPVEVYNPQTHYLNVRNRIFGFTPRTSD